MDHDLERDWQGALDCLVSYGLDPDEVVRKAGENVACWSAHPWQPGDDDFIVPEDDI